MLILLLGSLALLAQAQPATPEPDPLKSRACVQALDELEAARTGKLEGQKQPAAQVEQVRRRAARICLGLGSQADGSRPPARMAQPPQIVPPPIIAMPQRPQPPAAPQPAPPPQIPRPAVLTACDPGGCWDSNGTRLNRAGPNLVGPIGLCTVQGNLLNCP